MAPPDLVRWTPPQRIRPIAVALLGPEGQLLAMEARDDVGARSFYRPLGGGIEFGERGEDALRRELREEISANLGRVTYVATIENLYEINGARGHEIVLVYDADCRSRDDYLRPRHLRGRYRGRTRSLDSDRGLALGRRMDRA